MTTVLPRMQRTASVAVPASKSIADGYTMTSVADAVALFAALVALPEAAVALPAAAVALLEALEAYPLASLALFEAVVA